MTIPKQITQFLKENSVATVATMPASGDYPHAAPVFYVTDDTFHLFFISSKDSLKIKNIAANRHVAVSVTESTHLKTLEMKATAEIVKTIGKEEERIVAEISRVANAGSDTVFPPVMKLDTGGVQLVQISIEAGHFADYSGTNASTLNF